MIGGSENGYAYLISPQLQRDRSGVWHWAVTREGDFITVASGQSLSEAGAKNDALKAIRSQPMPDAVPAKRGLVGDVKRADEKSTAATNRSTA
jgi:hypothetical protein